MNESTCQPTECESCGNAIWQRPQFNLRFLFLAMILAAVWTSLTFVQNPGSLVVLAIVMLTWLFGCPRTKYATLLTAIAMLLPFIWLVMIDYPWNEYRRMWIGMWGHGFGIIPAKFLTKQDSWLVFVAAALTATFFLINVCLIRFWPRCTWWVFTATLAVTIVLSFGCYKGFRM